MRIMFLNPPSQQTRSALSLVVLASIWLAVLGNWVLWRNLLALPDLAGLHRLFFGAAFALIIACMTAA